MRATKPFYPVKNLAYEEWLRYLKLPSLYYRRLRGDMIMVFKMLTGITDNTVISKLTR